MDANVNESGASVAVSAKVDMTPIEQPKVFKADELGNVEEYMGAVEAACVAAGHDPEKFVTIGFNEADEIPAGIGIAVIPFKEREKVVEKGEEVSRKVVKGVHVLRIPDAGYMLANHVGKVEDIVNTAFITQLTGMIRRESKKPQTLAAFLEGTSGSQLVAFDKIAAGFIKVLGHLAPALDGLSKSKLKACLSSQTKASAYFPTMPEENWDVLLDHMINKAVAAGLEPGAMADWKENRTKVEDQAEIELDFNSLDLDEIELG